MNTPTNSPDSARWSPVRSNCGAPSPALRARAKRGLARFPGAPDAERASATDGGEE
ncbi:hypothetical protein [Streptomyces roseus]|uniref:hypothetical protein n=1 Tax=Streptomyces roseus TaxID=66430 RepID=UPI000A6E0CAD|nr:hypothetical protein [Streptomyces roseus]